MRILLAMGFVAGLSSAGLAQMVEGPEQYNPPGMEQSDNTASSDSSGGGWDYDWSGSYWGIAGGYALGSQKARDIASVISADETVHGTVVGAYAGTNRQISRFVFGTEMDVSKGAIAGDFVLPGSAWACGTAAANCSTEVGWHGSLRGRAGFAMNSFLPYVTVGGTLGETTSSFSGLGVSEKVSGIAYGWVAGVGLEYALMRNLILRGEALHYELSDVAERFGVGEAGASANFNVLRIGASLKF
jgi:outer membrane immunogenic protein